MKVKRLRRTLSVTDPAGGVPHHGQGLPENNSDHVSVDAALEMARPFSDHMGQETLPLPKLGLSSPWFSAGKHLYLSSNKLYIFFIIQKNMANAI